MQVCHNVISSGYPYNSKGYVGPLVARASDGAQEFLCLLSCIEFPFHSPAYLRVKSSPRHGLVGKCFKQSTVLAVLWLWEALSSIGMQSSTELELELNATQSMPSCGVLDDEEVTRVPGPP